MRYLLSFFLFSSILLALDIETNFDNSNILGYQKELGTSDYNRLRLTLDLYNENWEDINAKIILDNENIYNFKQQCNQNKSHFYRGYISYQGAKHMFSLGLQRVPFGVGRIWNPIDIFNPINITAVETQERKGTESLRYEYAINSLSNLDLTLSKDKQAIRVKGYLEVADVALVLVKDDEKEIIGYEVEGELNDITLRSEGGYFSDTDHFRYIIGAEYGFENSLIILTEFYHDTEQERKQLALNFSYQYSPILYLNFLTMRDFDTKTHLIAPSCAYSLSDESTLTFGTFLYENNIPDQYYLHYFINF